MIQQFYFWVLTQRNCSQKLKEISAALPCALQCYSQQLGYRDNLRVHQQMNR